MTDVMGPRACLHVTSIETGEAQHGHQSTPQLPSLENHMRGRETERERGKQRREKEREWETRGEIVCAK